MLTQEEQDEEDEFLDHEDICAKSDKKPNTGSSSPDELLRTPFNETKDILDEFEQSKDIIKPLKEKTAKKEVEKDHKQIMN